MSATPRADSNSYNRILEKVGGKELPLSGCYRCPRSHIELVNKIFPNIPIESAPTATPGKITTISETKFKKTASELTKNDLIISGKTAPLVGLCIKLISDGIAAIVKGRSLGESLKTVLKEVDKLQYPFERFIEALNLYRDPKFEGFKGLENEERLKELLPDKIAAISAIFQALPQSKSIEDLQEFVDSLFSDWNSERITLCTSHRAKGLEADRIFLYKPDDMPMSWRGIKPWKKEQEDNLLYVALTRSKSGLYIVGNPRWIPSEEAEQKTAEGDYAA